MNLLDYFDRVVYINLKRRADRRRAFIRRLKTCRWPFREPERFEAIYGDTVGVPPEFTQGGGAYGCRSSHLTILQRALMDEVGSVLVLEDDADFPANFDEVAGDFLSRVPGDWEGIMLGGQHHAPPSQVKDGVVRVQFAQRTHAYAARGDYLKGLQKRWGNCSVHIDWLMRDWQHQFRVYAPDRWIVGQNGRRSDIRGLDKPSEWWNAPLGNEPVVVLHCSQSVMNQLRRRGFHNGTDRIAGSGMDVNLPMCFNSSIPVRDRKERMRSWIETVQWECVGGGMLCTVWHPLADREFVKQCWDKGPVWEVRADTADDVVSKLPKEWQSYISQSSAVVQTPVVLLKSPASVMVGLRSHGFHNGFWRNSETDIDRGLESLYNSESYKSESDLREWYDVLKHEADCHGMIVTVWHPRAEVGHFKRVVTEELVEINAENVDDALEQWLDV